MSISAVTPRPSSSSAVRRWLIVAAAMTLAGLIAAVVVLSRSSPHAGPRVGQRTSRCGAGRILPGPRHPRPAALESSGNPAAGDDRRRVAPTPVVDLHTLRGRAA